MHPIPNPSLITNCLRLAVLCACVLSLAGCAGIMGAQEAWFHPTLREKEIERNDFAVQEGDDVVGRLAVVRLEQGDTLPDVGRHFSLGINAISAANPGVDIWVPEPGKRILLPLSFILPDAPRRGIVVNLATMRLFRYKDSGNALVVSTYPIGVGTKERPTPTGQMRVERKAMQPTWHVPVSISEAHRKKGDPLPAAVPPGPQNPLGEWALYLSKAGYLIHGTNKPASIGLNATNGCMRLYPENVKRLYDDTPISTPVDIVNQPYLLGQRDGVLYLEAHEVEADGDAELEKVYRKLRGVERKAGVTLDWKKIEEVLAEARGIPVPILPFAAGTRKESVQTVEVEHPEKLFGMPEIPELRPDAWYVLAAQLADPIEARRMAAIINHQGPPIPARVIAGKEEYRVIAGPFMEAGEAKEAIKRLRIDLEIEGILVEPVQKPRQKISRSPARVG